MQEEERLEKFQKGKGNLNEISPQPTFQSLRERFLMKLKSHNRSVFKRPLADGDSNYLHFYAFHNNSQIVESLIQYQNEDHVNEEMSKEEVNEMVQNYINQKNVSNLTALNYAANNGNQYLIRYLILKGADINKSDIKIIHSAAQGDQAEYIWQQYTKDKQMMLTMFNDETDEKKTPLHYAAEAGSENVVDLLLAHQQILKIDSQDSNGNTALHLAFKNAQIKIIQKLLIKGAKTNIQNKLKETAQSIAKKSQISQLKALFDRSCYERFKDYLKQYVYGISKPRLQQKSFIVPIVLFVILSLSILSIHLLAMQKDNGRLAIVVSSISIALCIFLLILYISLIKIPSYQRLKRKKQMCYQCQLDKPLRSHHCFICKTCIPQYDHHSFIINNCVGKGNIGRYLIFLYVLTSLVFISFIYGFFIVVLWDWQQESDKPQNTIKKLIAVSITIPFLYLLILLHLVFIHTKNVCINKTSYERFRMLNRKQYDFQNLTEIEEKDLNPLQQEESQSSYYQNCFIMCRNDLAED